MQFRQLDSFGEVGHVEGAVGPAPPSPPASMDPSDHLSPIREEALQLLQPNLDWTRAIWAAGIALLAGFGLGWAGNSSWNSSPAAVASDAMVQKDSGPRRAEPRPPPKADNARKQTTLGAPRSSFMTRSDGDGPKFTAALPAAPSLPAAPAAREPVVAAPETRPATVEGWTVVKFAATRWCSKDPTASGPEAPGTPCREWDASIRSCVGAITGSSRPPSD